MYRNHGIPKSFGLNTTTINAKKVGQLVAIEGDGRATTEASQSDGFLLPLINDVNEDSLVADVTIVGVAKVYVETAAGIIAGSDVGVGTTALGVEAYTSGFKLGTALATPRGDGDYIPVLINPSNDSQVY